MLQIDHVYEFLYQELFKDFFFLYLENGVPDLDKSSLNVSVFTQNKTTDRKIFFYDQEPFIPSLTKPYIDLLTDQSETIPRVIVTSERSQDLPTNLNLLYYFFHGFAALDWYRGHYALNYTRPVVETYDKDFVSYNRLILEDRSYRIYFISLLKQFELLNHGVISFNVSDDGASWRDEIENYKSKLSPNAKVHITTHLTDITSLVVDNPSVHGSASASILRPINSWMNPEITKQSNLSSFWHIVTETVFYYDKLHLTEKIFKPIVSKQPFMLLAAPGNLKYLKSYGFKTFDSVIDESYDDIQDNDLRTEAVVEQIRWYCSLPGERKDQIIRHLEPIIEYNFNHFYSNFKHIITEELLGNCKQLFKEIGYDDSTIAYDKIYKVLTN